MTVSNDTELPQHWKWVTLGEIQNPIGKAIVSGPFGSNIGSRFFVASGIPVIRGNNLALGMTRFIDDGFVFLTPEKAREFSNCEAIAGDLVFTAAGTIGQVGLIPTDTNYPKYIISNKQLRARIDPSVADNLFVYYWLSSPIMRDYIIQRNTGSSVPLINLSVIRSLPIPLPPLPIQREIAHILGSLDDKIDLNRRMNATLEAMARALFTSWFVNFDPVRAKAEGRQPDGIDADTAALFPDSFEDSALSPIPAGWRVGRFDELVVLQRGFDLPTSQRIPGKYPILAASGPSGTHHEYRVEGPGVTTGRSGVLGQVFFVHENYWPLNTSLWVKEFRASRPHHAFHLLSTIDFAQLNAGSAVPTLNRNHVHDMRVVIPNAAVLEAFEAFVSPLFQLKKANNEESEKLAATRDALLPRLMSGQIGV